MNLLVRVQAPHFCAGLVLETGPANTSEARVIEAAPILRWALRKPWRETLAYFEAKGYRVEMLP